MINTLKTLTGCTDDNLMQVLLETATEEVLAMTNRKSLNNPLKAVVKKWVIISYNRLGTEGEASRSAGGISASFTDIPEDLKKIIEQNRIARVGGHAYEKKPGETVLP